MPYTSSSSGWVLRLVGGLSRLNAVSHLVRVCSRRQVWYDNRASDLTKEGMLKGIEEAAAFVLFLSTGVLERPYCQMEIRHALALKKPIILIHGERLRMHTFTLRSFDGSVLLLQRAMHATDPSTSVPPTPKRHLTSRSCSISTSPCPSGGAGTSATGCSRLS